MSLEPGFVKAVGTRFATDEGAFPIVGVNCYFLAYCSASSQRAIVNASSEMGVNAVRCWGFLDVDNRAPGDVAFQFVDSGSITVDTGPNGLERLDQLIETAEANNLRLILPLVNYWDNNLGGMRLYLKWLGISGGVEEFYSSSLAITAYQNWVTALLTRRNTRTGRLYKEEPAILAWELANEPRCEIPGGRELLLVWIDEMSRFVKTLDSNHLVAVGDEGFLQHADTRDDLYTGWHGVDGEAILNCEAIDFGTYHFYPESMNHGAEFLPVWVADHVGAGQRANKPMLLEEYGVKIDGEKIASASERNRWYARWLAAVYRLGGAGDLLWMLGGSTSDTSAFRDDYTVLSAADVPSVRTHAEEMRKATSEGAI